MINLALAVLCSVMVSVFLKIAKKNNIIIPQAIAFNYAIAAVLCYFTSPNLEWQNITIIMASPSVYILLALAILLPAVFVFMAKAVEFAGIARSDAAQRLALFLPVTVSFLFLGEVLSTNKLVGLILAFIALFCLIAKPASSHQLSSNKSSSNQPSSNQISAISPFAGSIFLLLVWFGYGTIDLLLQQTSKLAYVFSILFIAFVLSACLMFAYLLITGSRFNFRNTIAGLVLGILNFLNILFYIKAHQNFSNNPTIVFAGMNLGVITVATIVGYSVFKEKISKKNVLGIVLALCAITFLFNLPHSFL